MFEQPNIESKQTDNSLVSASFDNALQLLLDMENGGDNTSELGGNRLDTSAQTPEVTDKEQMKNELAKLEEDKQKEIDQVISETTNSLNHDILQDNIT